MKDETMQEEMNQLIGQEKKLNESLKNLRIGIKTLQKEREKDAFIHRIKQARSDQELKEIINQISQRVW